MRYLVVVLVLAVGASAGVAYWFAYRLLPQTSGTISAPIAQEATVTRDELGVPHITAASEDDVQFLQGYVTAQDRLWQMDSLRRLAGGRLAEIVGPRALDSDREVRKLRLPRIAAEAAASMPLGDRRALEVYARGINFFINTHRNRLPLEFQLLGYAPGPWGVADCVLIGLHMFRTLTTTWRDELQKRTMLAQGDPARVNFLFPVRTGNEAQPGSNAWAVAGSRTASGHPMLANDMHLEFSVPGIWYMAHLRAPGLNVAGVSLPGVPGIIVGHNDRIAWGVTNLHFDVQDLYLEKFDDRSGRYEFRGRTEQARAEREVIAVKGRAPVEMTSWVTRHGPILVSQGPERMALRWVAAESGEFQFPFPEVNRARNWGEFTSALARFPGPGQNFLYADVDGNIGYHVAGKLPIRKTYLGDVPVDGTSGHFEWEGFIPFEQLPSAYNPPLGLIVSANQNPFPAEYPYHVSGNFASHYRSNQIRDLLLAKTALVPADMIRIQKDVYSGFNHYLARALVNAWDGSGGKDSRLAEAIGILRVWNGQMDKDQPAPLIVALAYWHLRNTAAASAAPGSPPYDYQMAPAVIEKLLRTRPAAWFPDYEQVLLQALAEGLEEGQRTQSSDVRKWRYGSYWQLLITHPVGHQLPLLSRLFDIGPSPMSGSSTTVKQTTQRLGPSMRMAADLADLNRSLLNVTIGQSGQVLSPHYKDQWEHYYSGQSFSMQFQQIKAKQVLRVRPQSS